MAEFYSMPTTQLFVFATDISLTQLARDEDYCLLDETIDQIQIEICETGPRRLTHGTIHSLFNILEENQQYARKDSYAKKIMAVAVKAGDYNLLLTLSTFKYSDHDSKALLKRYAAYRQEALDTWNNEIVSRDDPFAPFEKVLEEIAVVFRGRSLYFRHNDVEYRILMFDN